MTFNINGGHFQIGQLGSRSIGLSTTDNRLSFYSIGGLRTFYNLSSFHLKQGQLVQAFYSCEKPGNRIPADQLIVTNKNTWLFLFKGKYDLIIKNKSDVLKKNYIINVN